MVTTHDPEVPEDPPVAFNGITVLSLYLETFRFSFVQHWIPIETVLYTLLSMSEMVLDPQVKIVTVMVPVAFTELQLVPVSGIV